MYALPKNKALRSLGVKINTFIGKKKKGKKKGFIADKILRITERARFDLKDNTICREHFYGKAKKKATPKAPLTLMKNACFDCSREILRASKTFY